MKKPILFLIPILILSGLLATSASAQGIPMMRGLDYEEKPPFERALHDMQILVNRVPGSYWTTSDIGAAAVLEMTLGLCRERAKLEEISALLPVIKEGAREALQEAFEMAPNEPTELENADGRLIVTSLAALLESAFQMSTQQHYAIFNAGHHNNSGEPRCATVNASADYLISKAQSLEGN